MKAQIKQGKFETLNIPFHIYPNYRGVLSLFQVNNPKNIYISGLLPLEPNSSTYKADLYFKDKSITAIKFTLTFKDKLSGDIDVTELIEAIRQYSQYPDNKKAYLQGVVIPQIQAIPEPPINNATEVLEQPEIPKSWRKTRECKNSTEKLQVGFNKNLEKNLENCTKQCLEPQEQAISEQLTDSTQKSRKPLKRALEVDTEVFTDDIEVSQKVLEVLNEFQEMTPDEKELFTYFQYNLQEMSKYQGKVKRLEVSKRRESVRGGT